MTTDENSLPQPKKFANFNEFSEIKKIRKNSYKNSLNAQGEWPSSGIVYLFK